jgi:hypothetical protein
MANLGFVNILSWPPDQVANWLKGELLSWIISEQMITLISFHYHYVRSALLSRTCIIVVNRSNETCLMASVY